MKLDHIAVSGDTLEAAADHIEQVLGVPLAAGGKHVRFGTHNRLLGLADGLYIEAIAIDPDAPSQSGPRWFDLDRFTGAARLTNWICRVEDIETAPMPGARTAPVDLERGDLRWRMAVPPSGRLPYDNLYPALIEWEGDLHPAAMLPASGCALRRLLVSHPEADELSALLGPLPYLVFTTGPAALRAEIDTPHGLRVLE